MPSETHFSDGIFICVLLPPYRVSRHAPYKPCDCCYNSAIPMQAV